jgi:glycosyltransferase involved in cell wall biosynthesis
MRVLVVTSEWPTPDHPQRVPFVVQQVEHLRRRGIDVEVFPFRGAKNPLNYARAWLALRKQVDLQTFDVVHAQFGQSGLLAWGARIPLVVTYWGSDLQGIVRPDGTYGWSSRLQRFASRFVARRAAEVIVVSKHMTRFLPPRAAAASRVIPGGIDFDLFRPMDRAGARRELGLPLDRHLVLFPADPQRPVKRYPLAKQAVAWVNQHQEMEVDLVVLSGVSHDHVPVYMNACDALILTSKHEGSPTVVKEALACNLPVVAVDVGDVRERIGHVAGCAVCENDAVETIAEDLQRVLLYPRPIRGRASIVDLNVSVIAGQITEVYESAVRGYD